MVKCKGCGEDFERRKGYYSYCKSTCKGTNKNSNIDWISINNSEQKLSRHAQTCITKADESFLKGDKLCLETIRKLLIRRVNNTCEYCRLSRWMDKKIPLEMHHVDGNNKNNSPDNLHIICPNCHSQTDNFRSKNIKRKIK